MKPIFSRGPSLQIRLILAVLVALGVIIADSRTGTFSQIRTYMDTAVSPFYFVSNGPRELLDSVSQTLATRDQLELENRALRGAVAEKQRSADAGPVQAGERAPA